MTKKAPSDSEIIRRVTSGTTTRPEDVTVLWKDEDHALLKFASSKYWADTLSGTVTAPMHVDLLDLNPDAVWKRGSCTNLMEGKRLTKARLEVLIRRAKLTTVRKRVQAITNLVEGSGRAVAPVLKALAELREEIN